MSLFGIEPERHISASVCEDVALLEGLAGIAVIWPFVPVGRPHMRPLDGASPAVNDKLEIMTPLYLRGIGILLQGLQGSGLITTELWSPIVIWTTLRAILGNVAIELRLRFQRLPESFSALEVEKAALSDAVVVRPLRLRRWRKRDSQEQRHG